ncbi:MAG: recombinase family protein [Spiroplasmataceae bacterium]|nr:recombinase family protein [Spiroplasmataceae bacterium]
MNHCLAYLRVSNEQQDLSSQRELIKKHAESKNIIINEWLELEISSRKDEELRKIDQLRYLQTGDILITSELSRLGRSMVGVV